MLCSNAEKSIGFLAFFSVVAIDINLSTKIFDKGTNKIFNLQIICAFFLRFSNFTS
jgi:hypothetical protein